MNDWSTVLLDRIGNARGLDDLREILTNIVLQLRQLEAQIDSDQSPTRGSRAAILKFQDKNKR